MAFYDCKKLESIYIPDTVTEIGSSAFSKTSALKSIFIPASVKTIDHFAFEYWENDQTINCEHSEIIIKTSFLGQSYLRFDNGKIFCYNIYRNNCKS